MKKILQYLFVFISLTTSYLLLTTSSVKAVDPLKIDIEPKICSLGNACPAKLSTIYVQRGEKCVDSFQLFKEDPLRNHFWVDDPQVTAQGQADDRARQFIYWSLNNNAIDDHPVIKQVWASTRNIAYFLILLTAAVLGLGFIIGQKTNFNLKIKIWPVVGKIGLMLLYVAFSATIILLLIQLSEILIKFFIENLGGNKLFNIFFSSGNSQENNYIGFIGCRDLNYRAQESFGTEMFLLKLTNVTYYVLGVMLILRKILLWFLLFVSPFLAILFSFKLIKNTGWIWIGVFFQWLFYGPLLALFLGAVTTIWQLGIPFRFDFSRTNPSNLGYVYPTATNIFYGGPAQTLDWINSGNYVDTFVEYIISIIMLWAAILFPWWLLRIFRDYCCDGIASMKNILLSMYEQSRGNSPSPTPSPSPTQSNTSATMKISKGVETTIKSHLETIEEIRKTKTEDISKSLNLSVNRLTDVAHFETSRESVKEVRKNIDYLANPTKAETPTERQKYMNIKSELFNRAVKDDKVARQILSATSASPIERIQKKQEILQSMSKVTTIPVTKKVGQTTSIPAITPEKPIEQTISVPPTVALEEYEGVKKMWKEQYEKGEVPVTENIQNRHEWVDKDIIFITNTLNKLVANDNKLQSEGLDDLGYILPIFLINNLKGDELLVYLKAKLEAAKVVKEQMEREKALTDKLKAKSSEEELVDVEKPKTKEAEKTMEMAQEKENEKT